MSKVFEKTSLKEMKLKNRIVMAPMCMYSADEEGVANNFHLVHYTSRAMGGVGLIILEATAVEARGRISKNDLGIWDDNHISKLREIVDEAHRYGSKVGVQLGHAGRKCGVASEVAIAPSSFAFSDRYQTPAEMTKEDIQTVIRAFKDGAKRAAEAGFDTIEIHGAHGYLINQFLSPLTNKRTDEYGGSLENRVRLLDEILDAIQMVWPKHLPIVLRLSVEEYHEDGNHVDDYVEIVNLIKDKIDLLNISTGGVVSVQIDVYPGYQLKHAEEIKNETGVKTIAGGLVTDLNMVQDILHNERADYVYFGRLLLRDPYFVLQAAKQLGLEETIPFQYERGI